MTNQSNDERRPKTSIFGRTDLRKGVSEAKFDVEDYFDVEKFLAPPKSAENHEKQKKNAKKIRTKKIVDFFLIRNHLKRVWAKFCRAKTAKKCENAQKIAKIRFFMVEYV